MSDELTDEQILALPICERADCERVAKAFLDGETYTPFGILSSCTTKDVNGTMVRLDSGVIRRARLDGFNAATSWQPINTAPKDTPVYIWNGMHLGEATLSEFSGEPYWVWESTVPVYPDPTHWMPLPEPPPSQPTD